MAEARGKTEDRELKDAYKWVHTRGLWYNKGPFFQKALTSKEVKLKPKSANIAGLQLADLLAHPTRMQTLIEHKRVAGPLRGYAQRVLESISSQFNCHRNDGRVEGYGRVLSPK